MFKTMTSHRGSVMTATGAVLWIVTGTVALAALPDDQVVRYVFREDPADEESDVEFAMRLDLKPVSSNGPSIGWDITEIRFTHLLAGRGIEAWVETSPAVDTGDGLWWVEHADPATPRLDEFGDPPLLEGTAEPADPLGENLDYSSGGAPCDATCQQMYGGNTGALDHEFTKSGGSTTLESGVDESVQIDEDDTPPIG